jgi:DNA-directed RNA polymerase II subunit RPB2
MSEHPRGMNKKSSKLSRSQDVVATSDKAVNNLNINDIFKFMDLYFDRYNIMYSHLYNSFNKFLDEDVRNFLQNGENVFYEKVTKDKVIKYKFKYTNVSISTPTLDNDIEPMFPHHARSRNLTYSGKLLATVTQLQEIIDIATDEKIVREIGKTEDNVPIAIIPIMLRSKYCSLTLHKGQDRSECEYDPGGYFLVNGSEKVVISQDRMADNKPLVFIKKDSGSEIHTVQVNSKSYKPNGLTQVISIRMKKDGLMTIRVPILSEIPVFILFRALGIESDKDIINYVAYDPNDLDMVNVIMQSLNDCKNEKGQKIQTKEDALEFLMSKLRVIKKYSETDKNVKRLQKRMHLLNLLENSFLPHIDEGTFPNDKLSHKAVYIGYMINRLLRVYLKRQEKDDRDSYLNKRIDLPGPLIEELFKQYYRKMLNECNRFFGKRNPSDENPLNIINQIKPNIIEQGLKAALLTGSWIRRKGVAQMLQRLTYLQTLSFLRRIDAPGGDASTSKLTSPRHLHPSSVRTSCPVQTPEHAKVGLTKHLSIIGSITIYQASQYNLLKSFLQERTVKVNQVAPIELKNLTKVFLNGCPIGIIKDANKLYNELYQNKLNGGFDPTTGIVPDVGEREIRVYCDGGRLFAPAIRVENNVSKLTKELINSTSLNKSDEGSKITSWLGFQLKHPGIIENIDMEEQPFLMIAPTMQKVEDMRKIQESSIEKVAKIESNHVVNRYDDMFFVEYTHCEFHPSFLLGEISTNIPFCNSNQGPRNIFQYAKRWKQAKAFMVNANTIKEKLCNSIYKYTRLVDNILSATLPNCGNLLRTSSTTQYKQLC